MSKKVLITIGIIGLLALMIHYFLSYDQPIRYGGNIDPNNEEVIMDDENYNNLAKSTHHPFHSCFDWVQFYQSMDPIPFDRI